VFPSGNGSISQQEYVEFLKDFTNSNQNTFYETDDQDQEPIEGDRNRVTLNDQPIFLQRNLAKMKAA
jgi:hypothetical protein